MRIRYRIDVPNVLQGDGRLSYKKACRMGADYITSLRVVTKEVKSTLFKCLAEPGHAYRHPALGCPTIACNPPKLAVNFQIAESDRLVVHKLWSNSLTE